MATDPTISLQVQNPQIDLASIYKDAMALRQMKQQFQTQNALKAIAAQPDAIDPKTRSWTPNALKRINQIDPEFGAKAAEQASEAAERSAQTEHLKSETQTADVARHADEFSSNLAVYDAEVGSGGVDPAIAERNLKTSIKDYVDGQPWSPERKAQVWGTLSAMDPTKLRQTAAQLSMTAAERKQASKDASEGEFGQMTLPDGTTKTVWQTKDGQVLDPNTRQPIKIEGLVEHEATPIDPTRAKFMERGLEYTGERVDLERDRLAQGAARVKLAEEAAADGKTATLDDKAIDYAAQQYRDTGHMPALGMGKAAARVRQQILERAAGLASGAPSSTGAKAADSDVGRAADTKATTAGMVNLGKMRASVEQAEGNASREADLTLGLLDKGGLPGGPSAYGKWVQGARTGIFNDPDASAFNTATESLKNEYVKVLSTQGGMSGGMSSDSARKEADAYINPRLSKEQIKANIAVMKQSMANRTAAINQAYEQEHGRLTHKGEGGHTVPQNLKDQYSKVPEAKRAEAKRRIEAAGYDVSGL